MTEGGYYRAGDPMPGPAPDYNSSHSARSNDLYDGLKKKAAVTAKALDVPVSSLSATITDGLRGDPDVLDAIARFNRWTASQTADAP